MPKFTASWLDGPIELAPMPLKGERELRQAELLDSDIAVFGHEYRFLVICRGLIAAQTLLEKLGAPAAKKAWDEYLMLKFSQKGPDGQSVLLGGYSSLIWPEASFAAELATNKARFLTQELGAKDDADAAAKLDARQTKLNEQAKEMDQRAIARVGMRALLALYWRLRSSGVKTLRLPTGPHQIDWSDAARDKTLDALSEVVSEEELETAVGAKRPAILDISEVLPTTVADVEGKSGAASKSSTPSNRDSAPSSEATMATATG